MRLVRLRWDANPRLTSHPVFVDPDNVTAVYQMDDGVSAIILKAAGPILITMPTEVIVEQLFDGYGATRH